MDLIKSFANNRIQQVQKSKRQTIEQVRITSCYWNTCQRDPFTGNIAFTADKSRPYRLTNAVPLSEPKIDQIIRQLGIASIQKQ